MYINVYLLSLRPMPYALCPMPYALFYTPGQPCYRPILFVWQQPANHILGLILSLLSVLFGRAFYRLRVV